MASRSFYQWFGGGDRIMSLNASRCFHQTELILLAFADVTAIRFAEADMRRPTQSSWSASRADDRRVRQPHRDRR